MNSVALSLATRSGFRTLLDAVVLQAGGDAEVAIVFVATDAKPKVVTRGEFRRRVVEYAGILASHNIKKGDLIAIADDQNLNAVYAFWGAMWLGAMPAFFSPLTPKLDPNIYYQRLTKLINHSHVRAILTNPTFAPELTKHVTCQVISNQQPATSHQPPAINPKSKIQNPKSTAFLQHSSGTTGLQKGVALSHEAVLNQLASYSDAIALQAHDVVVSWLPLYHDMGLIAGFLLPLMQGIPLVLMSPFDWVAHPALLFRAIQQHRGTLCWLPNFAYNHCARRIRQRDLADISLDSMRLFINCSEPARHDSHELFLKKFASHGVKPDMLSVCYAMAENTFAVTQTKAGAPPRLDHIHQETLLTHNIAQPTNQLTNQPTTIILSCGKPIANTKIKVVAKDGNPLPDRHVGEIMVQSDCMLTNYHQRPDLQPFQNGWYETGDRGYVANGELFVVGRSKDVIINAGKNVYPQDIEAILNHIQGIHPGRVVCFGVPDQKEGTELLAIVAEVDTADADEHKALTRTIRQTVARQTTVTVTYIKLVEAGWLIKTSSGKIARASNRDKWMSAK